MKEGKDIIFEIRNRFKEAEGYWRPIFEDCVKDLKFFKGEQWDEDVKRMRDGDNRPCLTINKLPGFVDQVIGNLRQNEPSIKIKPVDSKADPKTAEILTGLIKNIEMQNDAETCYDTAAESAVICGIGAFRLGTDYASEDTFDLDITITRIKNPFTIYYDPQAQKWDRSDARYCFVTERIPVDAFKELYPGKAAMPAQGSFDGSQHWGDDKTVRVVEYWKQVPVTKTMYLLQAPDGNLYTTDYAPNSERAQQLNQMGWKEVQKKQVKSQKLTWYKASAAEILEGPTDWPGKYIPIPLVLGKELNIEGETEYRGVVRNSKDAQRLYNYSRSTGAEVISLAPKSPWLVTSTMIGPYQNKWNEADRKTFPYLPFDVDPKNPGLIPHRNEPIPVNTGIQQETIIADQELHDTSGMQLASLGKRSNEKSGKAILARAQEADINNFVYYDNLGRAMKYAGKIIVDLIPKIYDTARIVRIINPDMTEKMVPLNQPTGEKNDDGTERIYDVTVGKYDVMVSIGPSFLSQREEAAGSMMEFIQAIPPAGPLIGDLIAKNLDWPGAQEIEKRLKAMLPPQLQTGEDGKPVGNAQPPPPDPMQMKMIQMEVAIKESEAAKGKLEVEEQFYIVQKLKKEISLMERENEGGS